MRQQLRNMTPCYRTAAWPAPQRIATSASFATSTYRLLRFPGVDYSASWLFGDLTGRQRWLSVTSLVGDHFVCRRLGGITAKHTGSHHSTPEPLSWPKT